MIGHQLLEIDSAPRQCLGQHGLSIDHLDQFNQLLPRDPSFRAIFVLDDERDALHPQLRKFLIKSSIIDEIFYLLPLLHLIERGLSDIDSAFLYERPHVAKKEGHQQCPNVRTIHIGVRHDNNLPIPSLADVEVVLANPASYRGDDLGDFIVRQHLVNARLFHI